MEYLRLSWDDIEEQSKEIAREIRKRELGFDVIIALARGGWVPGRLLSDYLGVDELHTVRVKFYAGVGQRIERPQILHQTQLDIRGKDILLVDDIADTGESLIAAVAHLKERKAAKVHIVTLVKKPNSKFTPDIYARETSAWVVFPWEVGETVNCIAEGKNSGMEVIEELEKAQISEAEYKNFLSLRSGGGG